MSNPNVVIYGLTETGTPIALRVNPDGSLVTGLTFDGTVNVGEVSFSQAPGENTVVVGSSALPTGAASETTLAAVLAKLLAAPATEAAQTTGNGSLSAINGKVATETTLAAILAKLIAAPATEATLAALNAKVAAVNTGAVVVASGAVTATPVALSRANTTAYAASLVVKASAGSLFSVFGYNSGPAQFIQVHNTTSLPADGVAPIMLIGVPAASSFAFDFGGLGLPCSTGITLCNSTTGPTKTVGSANCYFTTTFL